MCKNLKDAKIILMNNYKVHEKLNNIKITPELERTWIVLGHKLPKNIVEKYS